MTNISCFHRIFVLCGCLTSLLLTACAREEAASYLINDDNRHSLSLFRTAYPWSNAWDVKLVTTHTPQCQRRHTLQEVPESKFRIDVYQPAPDVFILHQGKRWYVTEMGKCEFQQFEAPPPAPGDLVGQFTEKDEQFAFVDAAGKVSITAPLAR